MREPPTDEEINTALEDVRIRGFGPRSRKRRSRSLRDGSRSSTIPSGRIPPTRTSSFERSLAKKSGSSSTS